MHPDNVTNSRGYTDNPGLIPGEIAETVMGRFSYTDSPLLIAVGGPGGTGKSRFSRELSSCLPDSRIFTLDDYKTSRSFRSGKKIFGPHPDANEMDLLEWHLEDIKDRRTFFKPVYDKTIGAIDLTESYVPAKYNILDGEISTYRRFRDLVDFSVYIDAGLHTQLRTRLTRDIDERGYTLEKAVNTFWGSNVNEFLKYGSESKNWADIILFCREDYSLEIADRRGLF